MFLFYAVVNCLDDHADIVVEGKVLEKPTEGKVEVVTSGLEKTCEVGNNWKDLMSTLAKVNQWFRCRVCVMVISNLHNFSVYLVSALQMYPLATALLL